jgi:hypothetical protein
MTYGEPCGVDGPDQGGHNGGRQANAKNVENYLAKIRNARYIVFSLAESI